MFEQIRERFRTPRLQIPIQLIDSGVYSIIQSQAINPQVTEFSHDVFLYKSNPEPIDRRIIPGYMLDRFKLSNSIYFSDVFYLQCMQYMDNRNIVVLAPNGEYSSIKLSFDLFGENFSLKYDTRKFGETSNITANLKLGNNDTEYFSKQTPVSLDEANYLSSLLASISAK